MLTWPVCARIRTSASAGRPFPPYDPQRRYLTIRGQELIPIHDFLRIVLEQNGQSVTLGLADFSYVSAELLIVRLPRGAIRVGQDEHRECGRRSFALR